MRTDAEPHEPVRIKGEDVDYKIYYTPKWLKLESRVLMFFIVLWLLGVTGIVPT
jgi:hypothetical protein